VLGFMAAASALLVVQDNLVQRGNPAAEATAESKRDYGLVAAAFAVTGAYVALLPFLGFRIATVLFVAAFQVVLERPTTWRQWAVMAAVAVGTSAVTYVVFERYLTVLLPRGTWTDW
jgi:putative tricarboxylic transport membrane protein